MPLWDQGAWGWSCAFLVLSCPPVAFQILCSCYGASARPLLTLICGLVSGSWAGGESPAWPELLPAWPTRLDPIEPLTYLLR